MNNRHIALLALLILTLTSFAFIDGSDASSDTVYGTSEGGAKLIAFDPGADATDGYRQYVLNGNTIRIPTEHTITKSGYALMRWSDGSTTVYPGDTHTVTTNRTFYAVWQDLTYDCIGRFGGISNDRDEEAQHRIITKGADPNLEFDEDGVYLLMLNAVSRGSVKYTLTVTGNGSPISSYVEDTSASISADWLTLNIARDGKLSFSGTPNRTGVFEITVLMQTKGMGGSWGDLEDLTCKWYVSVYDRDNDASVIYHATYYNSSNQVVRDLYGPYGTVVKLPDSVSSRQKGWNVVVNNSPAIFPIGGTYTLVQDQRLTPNDYTYEELLNTGLFGVMAYNVNGGYYEGAFAQPTQVGGYTALSDGSIVTKPGFTFIGWNSSGSSADPMYPAGYLFDTLSEYNELKAVWVDSATFTKAEFRIPGHGDSNVSFDVAVGYRYFFPIHAYEPEGYQLKGWSKASNTVGQGTPIDSETYTVSSTLADNIHYAVYEQKTYTFTINYDGNGATSGTMARQSVSLTYSQLQSSGGLPYYMTISANQFFKTGNRFLGWALSPFSGSPQFSSGESFRFADSGETTLYAVWSERPQTDRILLGVIYHGNYSGTVENMPRSWYQMIDTRTFVFMTPTLAPAVRGYDFLGWSSAQNGPVEYGTASPVTVSIQEGADAWDVHLYAIWEAKGTVNPDEGRQVTVTFVSDAWTMPVSVTSGNTVAEKIPPAKPGSHFLGWFDGETKWDFSKPVTKDMTLTANYVKVFDLTVTGDEVSVVMKCETPSVKVSFSDGFEETYTSTVIPPHKVTEDGSVTVTAEIEGIGTVSAVRSFTLDKQQATEDTEEEDDGKEILPEFPVSYLIVGAVAIIALLAIARWFI